MSIDVSIVGASGYTGGELIRLLLDHPHVNIKQVTSRSHLGQYVQSVHPVLKGVNLQFAHPDELEVCDLIFLCLPHGQSSQQIERYAALSPSIIDLSADFRLDSLSEYQEVYGEVHPSPDWLEKFIYGLPELNREEIRNSHYVSGIGCNATTVNLALYPLTHNNWLDHAAIELKVGSSEAGNSASLSSHHPNRSATVRAFKPTQHRHHAEVRMILGKQQKIHFAVTSVNLIRGIHLTAHCYLNQAITEKEIWRAYRQQYNDEFFVRLVNNRTGIHRFPDPRVVAGTNFFDIGFELDQDRTHLVLIAAMDNLGKGAAGSAIQCMNLMNGFNENEALRFRGIYP